MRYLFLLPLIAVALFNSSYADELDSISNESLRFCILDYRDGYYARAVQCIDQVVPHLTSFRDSVQSYKMLALSYGMLNQIEKAKMYFGLALEKDTAMSIDTLAFPPNITLIYNQVKLEKKMSHIETTTPSQQKASSSQSATASQPKSVYKEKKSALAPVLLTTALFSTGGAVYLFYNGYIAHEDYLDLSNNQTKMDKKWKEYTYSIAGGIGCTVVSGVATWLFFRIVNKNSAVSISGKDNGISFAYNF